MKNLHVLFVAILFGGHALSQTPCDHIVNGNFEATPTAPGTTNKFGTGNGDETSVIPGWFATSRDPDYLTAGSNEYARLNSTRAYYPATNSYDAPVEEALAQAFSPSLTAGNYLLSLKVTIAGTSHTAFPNPTIRVTFSNLGTTFPPNTPPSSFESFDVDLTGLPVDVPQTITRCITTTNDWSRLDFRNFHVGPYTNDGLFYFCGLLLDDIQLIPLGEVDYPDVRYCLGSPAIPLCLLECPIPNESYSWQADGVAIPGNQSTLTVSPTATTTYTRIRRIFDAGGNLLCEYSDDIVVTVLPPNSATLSPSSGIVCAGKPIVLTGVSGATIASVTIDNSTTFTPNSPSWSYSFPTTGNHTITYTVDGSCPTATYSANISVTESSFNYSITQCGLATFTFYGCGGYNGLIQMNYGDGTTDINGLSGGQGTLTFTHQYSIGGPYNWNFAANQNILPPNSPYTASGTTNVISPLPLTVNHVEKLCELAGSFSPISIANPSGLTNIVWTVFPSKPFTGQGTPTIFPGAGWSTSTADITVTVTATDATGCKYAQTFTIEACCNFIFPSSPLGSESFERNYITLTEISSQSPLGYNQAPQGITINLPAPPTATNSYNTPHSGNINIAQLNTILGLPASSPTIAISNKWIFLNCDIVVDQNINFLNCPFVRIAPGVKIIVQTGKTLQLNNSTFAAKCREMWGGITGSGTSTYIKITNSNILHAINGVESQAGAVYQLDNSRFIDNYIGVNVQQLLTGTHAGYIQNCYFGDHPTANLLPPYDAMDRPYVGVRLQQVNNITIGNPNGLTGGNLFHRQQTGIDNRQSNMTVRGNTFYRIVENPTVLNSAGAAGHTAISAKGIAGANHWMNTIGTSGISTQNRNLFLTCRDNIYLGSNMNADIQGNLLKNITYHGIRAENNVAGYLLIKRNFLGSQNTNGYGVRITNHSSLTVVNVVENDINENSINFPTANQLAPRFGAGIYLANSALGPLLGTFSKLVANNHVTNAVYGIRTTNIVRPEIHHNTITIDLSDAVIQSDLSFDYTGILSEGSPSSNIYENTFFNNAPYSPVGSPLGKNDLAGIRLENSFASRVYKNHIWFVPAGFYALYQNGSSTVHCNDFYNNKFGFEFHEAEIGVQGLPPLSPGYPAGLGADNKWHFTWWTADRSEGTIVDYIGETTIPYGPGNPMSYYHTSPPIHMSTPALSLSGQGYFDQTLPTVAVATNSTCFVPYFQNILGAQELIDERTRSLSKFIIEIDPTDPQLRYAQLSTYQKLVDENLVALGDATDIDFQTFVNNFEQTSAYTILEVQKLIDAGLTEEAESLNLTIPETDPFSTLNKEVQGIYLSALDPQTGLSQIDDEQQARLEQIVCMDPLDAGSAIYQAKAILGWLYSCNTEVSGLQTMNSSRLEENNNSGFSVIYPNPSSGSITISNSEINLKSITFVDVAGKIIDLVNFENSDIREYETTLPSGLYIVTIELANGTTETKKLIIK